MIGTTLVACLHQAAGHAGLCDCFGVHGRIDVKDRNDCDNHEKNVLEFREATTVEIDAEEMREATTFETYEQLM